MKYSQSIGLIAAIIAIGSCFMPWVIIEQNGLIITGFDTTGTRFGKPGLFIVYTCSIAGLLFLIPKIWSKRINVFIAAFAMCWAIRNYLIITACYGGECPKKQAGFFILLAATILVMMMALLPKMQVDNEKPKS
ncbi:MAG: hypothetical protein EAZ13_02360 [Sphingobacteriia bacterium]|nr:MAG: hypothetical protein EAZ13_02360 [Sphingobacteriia bacterium]